MRCFFCSNYVNPDGRHVTAGIRHCYKNGGQRDSERTFHEPCFDKFQRVGRPWNPETEYEVLWDEAVVPGKEV